MQLSVWDNFRFHYYCIRFGIIFSQINAVMTAKSTCKDWFTIIPKDVQEAEEFGSTRISEAQSAVAVQDKLKDQVKLWSTKWWMFALQVSTNNFTVNFPHDSGTEHWDFLAIYSQAVKCHYISYQLKCHWLLDSWVGMLIPEVFYQSKKDCIYS